MAEPRSNTNSAPTSTGAAFQFDVLVIGAGTGGYPTAIRAAQLGLRVGVVERDKVGGLCLHRGCIPTKTLLESARVLSSINRAADFGIRVDGTASYDYAAMLARKDKIVGQMYRGVEGLFKKYGATQLNGLAEIVDAHTVRFTPSDGEAQTLTCKNLVLATGANPLPLDGFPFDGERILNTDQLLARKEPPQSIVVLGSGAWATEWAFLLATLGSTVTLVEAGANILPDFDPEVGKQIERLIGRKLMKVVTKAKVDASAIKLTDNGVSVELGKGGTVEASCLLVARGSTGRIENGAEKLGLTLENSFVRVDEFGRTNVDGVYAVGDVSGGLLLAHEAMAEGIAAVEHIAGKRPLPLDRTRIPRMAYTWPECASIGLSEEEAKSAGREPKSAKFPYSANGRAQGHGEPNGFVKVVTAADGEVLGVHIVGPNASELIGSASIAQLIHAVAWEVGAASFPHPTVSEAIWEAARMIDGAQIHL